MMNAINLIDLHNYKENRNFWSINGKGHYTVKLCSTILDRLIYPGLKIYNVVTWKGVSPSKTEFLPWLAMHNRLYTRSFFGYEENYHDARRYVLLVFLS